MGRTRHTCSKCGERELVRRLYVQVPGSWKGVGWFCTVCKQVDMDPAYAP